MPKAKKQTHKPVWGTSHVSGYLKTMPSGSAFTGKVSFLTDFHGKDAGWVLYDKKHAFTNIHGDKSYAVILTSRKRDPVKGTRYALGYYLGDGGDLVRAEKAPEWNEKAEDAREFDKSELWRWAQDISQYWFDRDEEDREKFEAEQAAEISEDA